MDNKKEPTLSWIEVVMLIAICGSFTFIGYNIRNFELQSSLIEQTEQLNEKQELYKMLEKHELEYHAPPELPKRQPHSPSDEKFY